MRGCLAVLCVAVLSAVAAFAGPKEARKARYLAVLEFHNARRDKDVDWVGAGAAEVLRAKLRTVPGLVPVGRYEQRFFVVKKKVRGVDPAKAGEAVRLGKALFVERVVVGSFRSDGEAVTLDVRIVDVVSGKTVATARARGKADAPGAVNGLAEAVVRSFDKKIREPAWGGSRSWSPPGSANTCVTAAKISRSVIG